MVDGFVHRNFEEVWPDLVEAACEWGGDGARMGARVAAEDEEKRETFRRIGFGESGSGEPFDFTGRQVRAAILSRP